MASFGNGFVTFVTWGGHWGLEQLGRSAAAAGLDGGAGRAREVRRRGYPAELEPEFVQRGGAARRRGFLGLGRLLYGLLT